MDGSRGGARGGHGKPRWNRNKQFKYAFNGKTKEMRGHTGGVISLGKGAVLHNCTKQKINTKSSTESEVAGVSDFLPYTIWASHFLKAQGYKLIRNIFYQDNTSAIKMLKNGKESCGSKSRHIHTRYFLTKDVIKREEMEIQYCPTEQMIADFYTNPIQGKQLYKLRNIRLVIIIQSMKQIIFPYTYSHMEEICHGSSSDTTANKINPYYLIG